MPALHGSPLAAPAGQASTQSEHDPHRLSSMGEASGSSGIRED